MPAHTRLAPSVLALVLVMALGAEPAQDLQPTACHLWLAPLRLRGGKSLGGGGSAPRPPAGADAAAAQGVQVRAREGVCARTRSCCASVSAELTRARAHMHTHCRPRRSSTCVLRARRAARAGARRAAVRVTPPLWTGRVCSCRCCATSSTSRRR